MRIDFDKVIDRKGTNCLKWDKSKQIFGRDDILPMWVADTDFKAPDQVINAMKKRLDHGIFGYTYRSESYKQSIVDWMWKRHGWEIKSEWITFSPGIVPALSMCIRTLTQPGEKVVIQSPIYPPFSSVIQSSGRIIVDNGLKYENGKYFIDFEDLNNKMLLKKINYTSNTVTDKSDIDSKIKMLLLCNPHNPGGRVWTKSELLRIGKVCTDNNIIIVSDEIHSDIIYSNHKHIPIASLTKELEQNTITCISPSKTFSLAGLSTSAIIIPNEKLRNSYNNILESLELDGGNIFGAVALEAAYNHGEKWLEEFLAYVEVNLNYLMNFFKERIPSIKPVKPEATYLVWLDCTELELEGRELMDFFVNEAKVGLNPGTRFGLSGNHFVRMNIGCSRSLLEEGLIRIEAAVNRRQDDNESRISLFT